MTIFKDSAKETGGEKISVNTVGNGFSATGDLPRATGF
jgi:hypothetical protein